VNNAVSKNLNGGRITKEVSSVKHHKKIHLDMSSPVILMYRPRLGGWTPSPHGLMLNHQLYEMKVFSITEKFKAREIVAVNPLTGTWETIWLKEGEESSRPESYKQKGDVSE
jgi:hypothetical protein